MVVSETDMLNSQVFIRLLTGMLVVGQLIAVETDALVVLTHVTDDRDPDPSKHTTTPRAVRVYRSGVVLVWQMDAAPQVQ